MKLKKKFNLKKVANKYLIHLSFVLIIIKTVYYFNIYIKVGWTETSKIWVMVQYIYLQKVVI